MRLFSWSDAVVELHKHRAVLLAAEHGLEENVAGKRLVADEGSLASARVDHQGKREGKFGALREVVNRLLFAILLEHEVVLRHPAAWLAVLAFDDGGDFDDTRRYLERGHRFVNRERIPAARA